MGVVCHVGEAGHSAFEDVTVATSPRRCGRYDAFAVARERRSAFRSPRGYANVTDDTRTTRRIPARSGAGHGSPAAVAREAGDGKKA